MKVQAESGTSPAQGEAGGEIETAHPGYLGAGGTFLHRHAPGCGAGLPAHFSGHFSETRVRHGQPDQDAGRRRRHCCILTDLGGDYCGKAEEHDYQSYLALTSLGHIATMANHRRPQTGIYESFHKPIVETADKVSGGNKL